MKTIKRHRLTFFGIFSGGLIVVAVTLTALSQTAPVLTITPLGTNQYSIASPTMAAHTITMLWTPMLANPDYPWTWAAIGTTGQTNLF